MPAKGCRWTLSEEDQREVVRVAAERAAGCRRDGAKCVPMTSDGPADGDREGLAAEFAFCRMYGIEPDTSIARPGERRPQVDATLPNGLTVDVKSTKYSTGRLYVSQQKSGKPPVDCYSLMTGSFPGPYTLRGFKSAADVFATPPTPTEYGPAHVIGQSDLVDLEDILHRRAA